MKLERKRKKVNNQYFEGAWGEALRWWSTCWMSCVIKTVESFPQMETGKLLFSDNLGYFLFGLHVEILGEIILRLS